MSDGLQISLLGELQFCVDDQSIVLPASRKARALLAYLVATGRPHRRERLCELFWDQPDDPKAALRWALSKLRSAFGEPFGSRIVADRERVSFDSDGLEIDFQAMHYAARSGARTEEASQLEEMARTSEQVFLDGLDGAGSSAFDNWLLSEREDLRISRAALLRQLALDSGLHPMAAEKWRRMWLDVDPEGALKHDQAKEIPHSTRPQSDELAQQGHGENPLSGENPLYRKTAEAEALRAQRIGFCEVPDGTRIAYAKVGSGPPILKAANWLTHLEFDWSSPIWGRSFAEIAQNRTFIRYDERGNGLSDWEVNDLSFEAFVEDLEVVADSLNLERFPLIGISQGAAVSIEYAVRKPERVSGLILVSGYAAGWRILASAEEQARREAVLKLTEVGWGTDNPAYRHIFSQTFMPDAKPDDLTWFDEFQRQTTSPENAARFQDAFGFIDVRDRLAEVQAPTIVFHSRFDQRIPIEQGRELATGIFNAEFVPLDSRNHILVEDEPALQVFMDTVADFLRDHKI